MLGKGGSLPPSPGTYFSAVEPDIRGDAQIVFANLEGTLSDVPGSKCAGSTSGNCFAFQVPPSYAEHLAGAGFTVLNTANNHSHDFGQAGLDQTVRAIRAANMVETGLPGEVTVVQAGAIRVGFVGFAPYAETASMLDFPTARALVRSARQQSDVVVVYMHAGAEGTDAQHVTGEEESYVGEDRGNAQQFAHMAIDEGAALVLGSGPHVLRGAEFYKGHLIAYSLGNFAGFTNFNTSSGVLTSSAILHVTLNGAGEFQTGRIIPVTLTAKNQPMPGGGAVALVARLSDDDFGSSAAQFAPDGTITSP
jgi:poly-gamma-glutamate capsule biosynthesis protein CapA/YwtB (metallophosphatase superfamily)